MQKPNGTTLITTIDQTIQELRAIQGLKAIRALKATLLILLLSLPTVFAIHPAHAQPLSNEKQTLKNPPLKTSGLKLMVLGDSLSASYGIPEESGWVTLLDKHLKIQHQTKPEKYSPIEVINASISGETTGGALNRFPRLLAIHQPDIVLIELGGNDGLRGYPISTFKNNLSELIELSLKEDAKVLLMSIQIPPNYGRRYTQMFYETYSQLAQKYDVNLAPFILSNIAINPELMQADGIHPTAEAQPMILQNLLPHLDKVL